MKWRSYLCVSVWKNSREGETAWKRETKQAKKLRETERERERKGGKKREIEMDSSAASSWQPQPGNSGSVLFSCFFFVFLAFAAMNQDVASGVWLCLMSASANNLPGSLSEPWSQAAGALIFEGGALWHAGVSSGRRVGHEGKKTCGWPRLSVCSVQASDGGCDSKRGETLWMKPALEPRNIWAMGQRNCRFQVKSMT